MLDGDVRLLPGQFLGNPLTSDGVLWVEDVIRDCLTTRKAAAVTNEWADFYKDELDFPRIVLEALERVTARS